MKQANPRVHTSINIPVDVWIRIRDRAEQKNRPIIHEMTDLIVVGLQQDGESCDNILHHRDNSYNDIIYEVIRQKGACSANEVRVSSYALRHEYSSDQIRAILDLMTADGLLVTDDSGKVLRYRLA